MTTGWMCTGAGLMGGYIRLQGGCGCGCAGAAGLDLVRWRGSVGCWCGVCGRMRRARVVALLPVRALHAAPATQSSLLPPDTAGSSCCPALGVAQLWHVPAGAVHHGVPLLGVQERRPDLPQGLPGEPRGLLVAMGGVLAPCALGSVSGFRAEGTWSPKVNAMPPHHRHCCCPALPAHHASHVLLPVPPASWPPPLLPTCRRVCAPRACRRWPPSSWPSSSTCASARGRAGRARASCSSTPTLTASGATRRWPPAAARRLWRRQLAPTTAPPPRAPCPAQPPLWRR